MLISDAQSEVRTVYLGGFVGQLVSALIWFASARRVNALRAIALKPRLARPSFRFPESSRLAER